MSAEGRSAALTSQTTSVTYGTERRINLLCLRTLAPGCDPVLLSRQELPEVGVVGSRSVGRLGGIPPRVERIVEGIVQVRAALLVHVFLRLEHVHEREIVPEDEKETAGKESEDDDEQDEPHLRRTLEIEEASVSAVEVAGVSMKKPLIELSAGRVPYIRSSLRTRAIERSMRAAVTDSRVLDASANRT